MAMAAEMDAAKRRPITEDGERPNKRFYRARAHINPFSFNDSSPHPAHPSEYDWRGKHYPNIKDPRVTVLDVGCGFGGLTVELATLLPDEVVLGMEIRPKVCEFVRLRIEALRKERPGQYENASALRTNAMLYLPNFIRKAQLSKMFFCFPDPHFKAKNHKRRIVSTPLLTEYAYYLRPGGVLYTITDVEDLHRWHVEKVSAHPCFERIPDEVAAEDPAVKAMIAVTEEGKKVERNMGSKFWAIFRRKADEEIRFSLLTPAPAGGNGESELDAASLPAKEEG